MLLTRERPLVPAGLLPAPAPLPSLPTAFSRRATVLGPIATAGAAVAPMPRANPSPDAWLIEIGEDMAAADRAVGALTDANPDAYEHDPAWHALVKRFHALAREMERMPAITADGLLAKAQVLQIPWVAEDRPAAARLGLSMAADVRHLYSPSDAA